MNITLTTHYSFDITYCLMSHVTGLIACAAFELTVNDEFVLTVTAESGFKKEDLPSIADSIELVLSDFNGIQPYCIMLCNPGTLPRMFKNGRRIVNAEQCKKQFYDGKIAPVYLRTHAKTALRHIPTNDTNLIDFVPQLDYLQVTQGKIVDQDKDDRTGNVLDQYATILDVLAWRSTMFPDDAAFISLDAKCKELKVITNRKLTQRILQIAQYLADKVKPSSMVIITSSNQSIDFVASLYACMINGCVPVPIPQPDTNRLSEDVPALLSLITDLKIAAIIACDQSESILKGKILQAAIRQCSGGQDVSLPLTISPDKINAPVSSSISLSSHAPVDALALVMVNFTPDMRRACIKYSHANLFSMCRSIKNDCYLLSSRPLITCARTHSGFGLLYSSFLGIYSGVCTLIYSPADFYNHPSSLFEIITKYKVKDVYTTYPMMEHVMKQAQGVDYRAFTLENVKSLMIPIQHRPNTDIFDRLVSFFLANRLENSTVTTVHSPFYHPFAASRSYQKCAPQVLKLALRELRSGLIKVVEEEDKSIPSIRLHDSGKPSSGTTIAIVNPVTLQLCKPCQIGEIWISSTSSPLGFIGPEETANASMFQAPLVGHNFTFSRTGDLGFLWPDIVRPDREHFLYFLGSMEETLQVNGLDHFQLDVENTVQKCHSNIAPDGCVVLEINQQIVVIIQPISAGESQVLATIPSVLHSIADVHQFVPDTILFVQDMRRSRFGEKQRDRIRHMVVSSSLRLVYEYLVK